MSSEETCLLNPDINSKTSVDFGSSSSTVIVDVINAPDEIKNYGTVESEPAPEASHQTIYNGIRDMLLASFAFSAIHLILKLLTNDGFPVSQILTIRAVVMVLACILYANYYKIPDGSLGPAKGRFCLHIRGSVGAIGSVLFFLSMTHLELGDAVAMSFIAPVVMPIFAMLWLGEAYTAMDAGATFLAMSGVIFISKPEIIFGPDGSGAKSSPLGMILAFISALIASVGNLSIRALPSTVHPIQIVNYTMLWVIPGCSVMIASEGMPSIPVDFHLKTISLFTMLILLSLVGQFLMSRSLQTTPTRYVTPIVFTQVIFAYINQFIFFGTELTSSSTIGVLFVGASLVLLHFKIK